MDAFADRLGRVGAWCGQNKYLGAIKNAFQNYMPATIAGAIGVLWNNVLINSNVTDTGTPQGLGGLVPAVMVLEPVNAVFGAITFATIGCISIGIVMLVAQEIGEANGETGAFPAVLGFMSWAVVTPTVQNIYTVMDEGKEVFTNNTVLPEGVEALHTIEGIQSGYMGATGLFTALIIGIIALEIYNQFRKMDGLKIKMPEQVPPGVARAFEVLIPTFLTLLVVGLIGWIMKLATGQYFNDVIAQYVQEPLQKVLGGNLISIWILYALISLFWLVGIHGNNMLAAVKEPIFKPLLYANTAIFDGSATQAQVDAGYNTFNMVMLQMFGEWGGSGVTLGLVIAIFIFGKREDNRAIATLSVVPGLFNINETVTFGIPLVLNPILGIPFILAPIACITLGYFLIESGICPPIVIEVPWTMPPVLLGFLATGGKLMGAASQLLAILLSTVIYTPFLIAYEKFQNKQAVEAE